MTEKEPTVRYINEYVGGYHPLKKNLIKKIAVCFRCGRKIRKCKDGCVPRHRVSGDEFGQDGYICYTSSKAWEVAKEINIIEGNTEIVEWRE